DTRRAAPRASVAACQPDVSRGQARDARFTPARVIHGRSSMAPSGHGSCARIFVAMHRFATLVVVALAAALSAGCAAQSPRNRASSAAGPAVGLIAEGNAFQRSGMRNAVVAGIARATGRDVVVVDAPASADDGQTKDLAAKLAKEDAALARYNWRETRCAADWVMLTAARNGLAGVYRMTLDYAERRTPASKTDVLPASRHALRAVLGAIG